MHDKKKVVLVLFGCFFLFFYLGEVTQLEECLEAASRCGRPLPTLALQPLRDANLLNGKVTTSPVCALLRRRGVSSPCAAREVGGGLLLHEH